MLMCYAFTPYLTNQYVILRYFPPNLCKWNYLYGNLTFYKIQVNHFMAWDESSGARIITKCNLGIRGLVPFWVLRHSFLFINRLPVTIWHSAEDWQGVLFLPPSDAYVRSFLYLLYTLIKLSHTKPLSDPALSLAPDWIRLLWRPRIPASYHSATTFQFFRHSIQSNPLNLFFTCTV